MADLKAEYEDDEDYWIFVVLKVYAYFCRTISKLWNIRLLPLQYLKTVSITSPPRDTFLYFYVGSLRIYLLICSSKRKKNVLRPIW